MNLSNHSLSEQHWVYPRLVANGLASRLLLLFKPRSKRSPDAGWIRPKAAIRRSFPLTQSATDLYIADTRRYARKNSNRAYFYRKMR